MLTIDIEKKIQGSEGKMDLKVCLEMAEQGFIALSGESGAGKSTLLRILAGLEDASGKIQLGETSWLDGKKSLSPQQRDIGFVFQDYALFDNMSVEQNLLYVSKDKVLAEHLLELTHMTELKKRRPHMLSGGQKQRVSLCRALMRRPKLLLMDEPLSALDPQMRSKLQQDILNLHQEFGTTTIMVSHDPSEIYKLADRVITLKHGKVVQDGTAKEVFLQARGSQKFSLQGELLEIVKADVIYIAVVAIGQQLVEIVLDEDEAKDLEIGQRVEVSTKPFSPFIN